MAPGVCATRSQPGIWCLADAEQLSGEAGVGHASSCSGVNASRSCGWPIPTRSWFVVYGSRAPHCPPTRPFACVRGLLRRCSGSLPGKRTHRFAGAFLSGLDQLRLHADRMPFVQACFVSLCDDAAQAWSCELEGVADSPNGRVFGPSDVYLLLGLRGSGTGTPAVHGVPVIKADLCGPSRLGRHADTRVPRSLGESGAALSRHRRCGSGSGAGVVHRPTSGHGRPCGQRQRSPDVHAGQGPGGVRLPVRGPCGQQRGHAAGARTHRHVQASGDSRCLIVTRPPTTNQITTRGVSLLSDISRTFDRRVVFDLVGMQHPLTPAKSAGSSDRTYGTLAAGSSVTGGRSHDLAN